MFDLISIGDVTEDVFVQVSAPATVKCERHNQHRCELCIPLGTKLAIDWVDKLLGGNAGNVAIGSSRLKLKSALYAEVGEDSTGKQLLQSLRDDKVSAKYFYLKHGQKTNYSVVLDFHDERTILVHHEPRDYKLPRLKPARWTYLTSAAKGSRKLLNPILDYVTKTRARLGFNPGTHQLDFGLPALRSLLRKTTVLFLNTEEAQQLLSEPRRDFRLLLRRLHTLGPEIAVITDGGNGSYCYDGTHFHYCPIYHVPVVEKTGTGDAYATGFICALFYDLPVSEAMRWGSVNAAGVLQRIGPQEGLLKFSMLKKILKANQGFRVRELDEKEELHKTEYYPRRYGKF